MREYCGDVFVGAAQPDPPLPSLRGRAALLHGTSTRDLADAPPAPSCSPRTLAPRALAGDVRGGDPAGSLPELARRWIGALRERRAHPNAARVDWRASP